MFVKKFPPTAEPSMLLQRQNSYFLYDQQDWRSFTKFQHLILSEEQVPKLEPYNLIGVFSRLLYKIFKEKLKT